MQSIKTFISVFVLWTLVGVVSKIPFLLLYCDFLSKDSLLVLWHGLRLDFAIAGYLTLIPGVLLILQEAKKGTWYRWLWKIYFAIISFYTHLQLLLI